MQRYLSTVALVAAILVATPAFATKLTNPSFEKNVANNWVTSIPDYTLNPTLVFPSQFRAGNFFSYESFSATGGNAFAAITHSGGGDQKLVTSAFTLDDAEFNGGQLTVTSASSLDDLAVEFYLPGDAEPLRVFASQLREQTLADRAESFSKELGRMSRDGVRLDAATVEALAAARARHGRSSRTALWVIAVLLGLIYLAI